MPFCSECGRHIPESESTGSLCEQCKVHHVEEPIYPSQGPQRNKSAVTGTIIGLILLMGIGVFFFLLFPM